MPALFLGYNSPDPPPPLPAVGVMDMLRFDKFTIGWGWTSDYGSADICDQSRFRDAY